MQTCRQSRLEAGADFGVSLVVNLVTQVLFYGALATAPEAPRSLTPLEARGALFDKGPDAFPGVLRFTTDVLREGFKFQGSAQIYVLVVIQGPLGQAESNGWPIGQFARQFVCCRHEFLRGNQLVE
jgi:hypothetical protein